MRKLSVTESELRQAIAHMDKLMTLLPKIAKELTGLKDILNEAIINLQQERMRLYKEESKRD